MPSKNLRSYWHAIALSDELKASRTIKRNLLDERLMIWRDANGLVHSMLDCCLHRRAPLRVDDYQSNQIVCPYHGWEYDLSGKLTKVPSDPKASDRLNCIVPSYPTIDYFGFIWILPLPLNDPKLPFPYSQKVSDRQIAEAHLQEWLELDPYREWPTVFRSQKFQTSDELLIDNFMDPTHTSIVHDGLIRKQHSMREHEMLIETHPKGLRVLFEEQEESVGFGLKVLFGPRMRVKHRDEFQLPNLVKVIYEINGQECFLALIACTPIDTGRWPQTLALVQLRYQLGKATRIAAPLIGWLANKVIKQDLQITQAQHANQVQFPNHPEHHIAADAVFAKIKRKRLEHDKGTPHEKTNQQRLRVTF